MEYRVWRRELDQILRQGNGAMQFVREDLAREAHRQGITPARFAMDVRNGRSACRRSLTEQELRKGLVLIAVAGLVWLLLVTDGGRTLPWWVNLVTGGLSVIFAATAVFGFVQGRSLMLSMLSYWVALLVCVLGTILVGAFFGGGWGLVLSLLCFWAGRRAEIASHERCGF